MKINNEIKIGIMVVTVLILLFGLTVRAGDFSFKKEGYSIKVLFEKIDGVATNAPVLLNGFEVGSVQDIQIVEVNGEAKMELTVWLEKEAKIKDGAKAYVKNMGFMGEKYVGLTFGNKDGAYLTPGAVIVGQNPGDFDQLLLEGQDIAVQIKEISTSINAHLKKNDEAIDKIIANLDTTMTHLASISTNVDERLKLNQNNIDEMMANFRRTSSNLDEMSADLKVNPWKLLYRPKK